MALGEAGEADEGSDLVIVALPGVQRFITEARSTSDVSAASAIYSRLAWQAVDALRNAEPGARLVLPAFESGQGSGRGAGMPNRVVALLPKGRGKAAARAAASAVSDAWQEMVRATFEDRVPATPGFPVVHWVSVPPDSAEPNAGAGAGGYQAQWETAQRLLAARRRVRDFGPVPDEEWRQRDLCSLSPRWPAEGNDKLPPRTPKHDKDAKLSAVAWVKRSWRRVQGEDGFPSTASIASAPYRQAILRKLRDGDPAVTSAVRALEQAARDARLTPGPQESPVPGLEELIPARDKDTGWWLGRSGGPWVYPERWEQESLTSESPLTDGDRLAQLASAGGKAARDLIDLMKGHGARLTSYLAVVVQDVDSMGKFLGGEGKAGDGSKITETALTPEDHSRVSRELIEVADSHKKDLASPGLLGVPVYAGGDDLLLFAPASTALAAAEKANADIPRGLPNASTAVLYFHYHASIQHAMSTAHRLLEAGKDKVPGKHALAVGYLRRSGATESSIQPWRGRAVEGEGDSTRSHGERENAAALFRVFTRDAEYPLSPRLAEDLERDAGELARLREHHERYYLAELARLVTRHTADRHAASAIDAAAALAWLGRNEGADGGKHSPHLAAKVAVFLRQEAR